MKVGQSDGTTKDEMSIASITRALAFSTTTPLGANGVYTSPTIDGLNYKVISIAYFADQAGSFVYQHSDDGVTWYSVPSTAVAASTLGLPNVTISKRYFRIVYTNGATPHTAIFTFSGYLSPL